MADDSNSQLSTRLLQALIGLVVLAVAGVAGGKIAGFKIEPEQCDTCGLDLASCQTRVELMASAQAETKAMRAAIRAEAKEREESLSVALEAAKGALIQAYQECR
jgi:hypothetical protein